MIEIREQSCRSAASPILSAAVAPNSSLKKCRPRDAGMRSPDGQEGEGGEGGDRCLALSLGASVLALSVGASAREALSLLCSPDALLRRRATPPLLASRYQHTVHRVLLMAGSPSPQLVSSIPRRQRNDALMRRTVVELYESHASIGGGGGA